MKPKLSVIVPVYNQGEYLRPSVESVLRQSFADLELILVDDGSTDGSGGVCDEYAIRDARVRVIHKPNGGVSSARNAGLDAACGDFVAFLDGDDWLEPTLYEDAMAALATSGADAFMFCHSVDYPSGRSEKRAAQPDRAGLLTREEAVGLVYGGDPFLVTKIFSVALLKNLRLNTDIHRGEDSMFAILALHKAKSVYRVLTPYYHYVQSENSAARGGVNARQLTGADALKWMFDFADREYPTLHGSALIGYLNILIELCYDMHVCKYRDEDFVKRAVMECRSYGKEALHTSKSRKFKLKLRLFRFSPAVFCAVIGMYRRGE